MAKRNTALPGLFGACADTLAMSLGNGPANGKVHALASRFRRIKRFKKVFQLSVAQPHAGVSSLYDGVPLAVDAHRNLGQVIKGLPERDERRCADALIDTLHRAKWHLWHGCS
ncbi:hypothetical protein OKW41_001669 [Paraburkholderia sp. UCT70]